MYRLGKLYSADEIVKEFHDGQTIMIGGFGVHGTPNRLIDLILESGAKHLTTITMDSAKPNRDFGRLPHNGRVDKMIVAHAGNNREVMEMYDAGKIEIDFIPMGTLAEKIRCGGMGLGGVLVKTGIGTGIEEGKDLYEIDGQKYIIEPSLDADLVLVRARMADPLGNLSFHGTNENINPIMAQHRARTIVDPDILVEIDEIGIDKIRTPGIFVDMILAD